MKSGPLAYVLLVSRDTPRTASVLGQHLGLAPLALSDGDAPGDTYLFQAGAAVIAVVPRSDGASRCGVQRIAFACDDPVAAARDAARSFQCAPAAPCPGLHGIEVPLPAEATLGVNVCFARALPVTQLSAPSRLVERIDHLGVVCRRTEDAVELFHRRLGLALESQQIDVETQYSVESFTSDKYGAVYHARPPAFCGGVRSAFITVGDCELEFLEDYDPVGPGNVDASAAGTTRQDRGAIARFLAERGPGLAHLAFKTPDIASALAAAERGGCRLIDRAGRPGGRRSQIAFIHPDSTGGILMHFVERR